MKKLNDLHIRILEKQNIGCSDVSELLGDLVDGDLTSSLEARVGSHLQSCKYCQEVEESYRLTVELAAELSNPPIPPEVRNRLRRALNERLGLNLSLVD